MKGRMQDWPLLVHTIIDHAEINHGDREVVSRTLEGPIHRTNYGQIAKRSRKLASALKKRGYGYGDILATMAWNGYRHMEIWYAISGLGAVCHTLNPRLFDEQLEYIVNHAEDQILFVDTTFLPIIEKLRPKFKTLKEIVVMTDAANMPPTTLGNIISYEELIATGDDDFSWPSFDENTACGLCYTSGTTGNPKGVLYSHRSNVLHAMIAMTTDCMGLKATDVVLPIVPMFHANAWALTYTAPMMGAKLVLPGAGMDGLSIYELLNDEKVTFSAAVPTIWSMLLQHLEANDLMLEHLKMVMIGGSACPRSMMEVFEEKYGVQFKHAWGMTEMSPLGILYSPSAATVNIEGEDLWALKLKQGRLPYGVEMRIEDENGNLCPRDGKAFGTVKVRGPAVTASYLKGAGGEILDVDGWFDTGEVGTMDEYGFFQITDRSKDVIKSGGEWISSIDLENVAVGHEAVMEAAVIGLPHPKWDERPVLVIVLKEGMTADKASILAFLDGKIVKWWTPDDVVFVNELPHTATGKISKLNLRQQFEDYKFPEV